MSVLLNGISVIGSFCIVLSLLYFIQYYTLGFIPIFKKEIKSRISLGDLTFISTSVLFILIFVEFYNPF